MGGTDQERAAGELGSFHRDRSRTGLLLVLPAVAVVSAFLLIPIGEAIYYSMTNWNGITSQWVGPSTYVTMFKDPLFWRVLENNGILLFAVPVTLLCGVTLAALLNEHVWGWRVFRAAIIIPTAVSWVVLGVVGIQAFAQNGMLNSMLGSAGLGFLERNWLGSPLSALISVGITFVYSLAGVNTLIFVTGMATIDPGIFEAARLDGATWWDSFFRLTVPLLKRYFIFTFVITAISAFSALFSLIFTMTSGGPNYGTTTIEFFIYQQAFGTGAFGTGALLGIVLFVILFSVSLLQIRLLKGSE
ncbi:MAG: carbohydrate ABC transporter permease [Ferrimicrobium sp.]